MRLLFEIFAQTLRTLWAHKLRSFLTMFGIAWGVGSLLLLVGLGEGFRSGNRKQFDDLGENVMFIWGGRAPAMNGSFTGLRQYYLTYKDYLDILRDATDVKAAAPVISRADVRAVSDFYNSSGQLMGVPIYRLRMAAGSTNSTTRKSVRLSCSVTKRAACYSPDGLQSGARSC